MFTIKARTSAERLNFDLHKTVGFYTTVVLVPVLFSGVYMDIPERVVTVLEVFSPVTYRYWFHATPPHLRRFKMSGEIDCPAWLKFHFNRAHEGARLAWDDKGRDKWRTRYVI